MAKPSAAEKAKLRSGLRARLGKPEPPATSNKATERRLKQQAAENKAERRKRIDMGSTSDKYIPPAERVYQPTLRRKPIIKGGAVIGRRTGGTTA